MQVFSISVDVAYNFSNINTHTHTQNNKVVWTNLNYKVKKKRTQITKK